MSMMILQQTLSKKIVLVDLQYPYGKNKAYMNGSLLTIAAQLMAAGHTVDVVDLNIDSTTNDRVSGLFAKAQIVGVSVVGCPYFPQVVQFCQYVAESYPNAQVVLGGQVIRGLLRDEFRRIFGKRAIQAATEEDCAEVFGVLPNAFAVPFQPVWERMGDERLRQYLAREFALILSQGCIFNCHFCAARKNEREQHRLLGLFRQDLEFLRDKAKVFGLTGLECYASALDFFQNPESVAEYMRVLAEVFGGSGVEFRMRALSCMNTFLKASRTIPNFAELVHGSGLWCIGFGVDGPDESVWKQQNKNQNHTGDVVECLDMCGRLGLRTEALMIMAYPASGIKDLWATVRNSYRYARRWPKVVLRPYLAKVLLPGNLGWLIRPADIEKLISDPRKFYNLDLCAFGSPITHPRLWQRWLANISYLAVILGLGPLGKCATSPLLPQGQGGLYGWLARKINRYMPFDR